MRHTGDLEKQERVRHHGGQNAVSQRCNLGMRIQPSLMVLTVLLLWTKSCPNSEGHGNTRFQVYMGLLVTYNKLIG